MKMFAIGLIILLSAVGCRTTDTLVPKDDAIIRFAVIADIQYADQPSRNKRFYTRSMTLVDSTITQLNGRDDLDFMVNLGDLIDTGIDNYTPMLAVLNQSKVPVFHVMGNHDFSIPDSRKSDLFRILGMPAPYYKRELGNWVFLFMDSNEISSYGHPPASDAHVAAMSLIQQYYQGFPSYEGGFGQPQMAWMENEIACAEQSGKQIVLCSHAPLSLTPRKESAAIDSPEMLAILKKYPRTVRMTLSGHYHAGRHKVIDGIHHLTLRGQVEAATPSYSVIELSDHTITIHGAGNQDSYRWIFK